MDFLAAFFLIGLALSGIRIFMRHLWKSLNKFNHTNTLLMENDAMTNVNLLSVVSHESNRKDANYIRVTSTKNFNDGMKRLAFPTREAGRLGYGAQKVQSA